MRVSATPTRPVDKTLSSFRYCHMLPIRRGKNSFNVVSICPAARLDMNKIKTAAARKKRGGVTDLASSRPGCTAILCCPPNTMRRFASHPAFGKGQFLKLRGELLWRDQNRNEARGS